MINFNDVRLAQLSDKEAVFEMFLSCTQKLIDSGLDQWNSDYPNQKILDEDIENQEMWIIRDNKRLASITLNEFQDKQYKEVSWDHNELPILVIHRLAVHPKSQGLGLGKFLCNFAEKFGRDHHYQSIRLDSYSINPLTMSLYQSLGYKKTPGQVFFEGPKMPVFCFEKKL